MALLLLMPLFKCSSQENIQKVDGFLPEIFSQYPNVRDVAISIGGDEIYFTAQSYLG